MSQVKRAMQPVSNVDPRSLKPNVRLYGSVDDSFLAKVLDAIDAVRQTDDPFVLEIMTQGGDADTGRRIALECSLLHEEGRDIYFIGKTCVMSAGVTIMSCFPAQNRFLDKRCELLIHERRMEKEVKFSGPLRSNIQMARELIQQIESGIKLEERGFRDLAKGSNLSGDEVIKRASENNWYVTAEEALELGLIGGVF